MSMGIMQICIQHRSVSSLFINLEMRNSLLPCFICEPWNIVPFVTSQKAGRNHTSFLCLRLLKPLIPPLFVHPLQSTSKTQQSIKLLKNVQFAVNRGLNMIWIFWRAKEILNHQLCEKLKCLPFFEFQKGKTYSARLHKKHDIKHLWA